MKIFHLILSISILLLVIHSENTIAENHLSAENKKTQKQNGEYVRKRFLQLMKKPFLKNNQTTKQQQKILIIGDSHAQDFLNAILENGLLKNSQISTRYIPTRCQIYLGEDIHEKWQENDQQLCEKSDNLEIAGSQINYADTIILAAFWRKWSVEALPETIKNLNLATHQTLFVIGRRSFRKVNQEDINQLNNQQLKDYRNPVDENQIEINNNMRKTLDEKNFINVHRLICGESSTCPAFTNDLKLISFDGGHLSQDGAKYIGNVLFKSSQLKQIIRAD